MQKFFYKLFCYITLTVVIHVCICLINVGVIVIMVIVIMFTLWKRRQSIAKKVPVNTVTAEVI